jgi:hypothetical protein
MGQLRNYTKCYSQRLKGDENVYRILEQILEKQGAHRVHWFISLLTGTNRGLF